MNKLELKQILLKQFVPVKQAVSEKLSYLMGDDFLRKDKNYFADSLAEISATKKEDSSLLNALNQFPQKQNSATDSALQTADSSRFFATSMNTDSSSVDHTKSATDYSAESKKNIAARIAALRGISLPGDYIKRK